MEKLMTYSPMLAGYKMADKSYSGILICTYNLETPQVFQVVLTMHKIDAGARFTVHATPETDIPIEPHMVEYETAGEYLERVYKTCGTQYGGHMKDVWIHGHKYLAIRLRK